MMLRHKAAKYLVLGPEAQIRLDASIQAYCAWHRKEMLPAYAVICRRIAQGLRGTENPDDNIRYVLPRLNQLYDDTVRPMAGPVAAAMVSLDAKGRLALAGAFAQERANEKKRYLDDPVGTRKRRVEKTLERVSEFAGDLSREQKAKIAAIALALPMPVNAWATELERRHDALIAMLQSGKSEPAVEAFLLDWWLESRVNNADKAAAQISDAALHKFCLGILETLTPAQRENAARTMEDYAADFEWLASQDK
jgi:hypothetical protein